jgi:hypothetical protein
LIWEFCFCGVRGNVCCGHPFIFGGGGASVTDDEKWPAKDEGLLVSVAESIGSTLGILVNKASAAQKSLGKSAASTARKIRAAKGGKRAAAGKSKSGKRSAKRRTKPAAKRAASKSASSRATRAKKKRSR